MAASLSAGILLYRWRGDVLEVLLVHPGGPYWRNRDAGAWQLAKGGVGPGEAPLAAARREFAEELGSSPAGEPVPLGRIRQAGGKQVEAFALEGELDAEAITSNLFELEWPPRSGRYVSYPEVDRARWFDMAGARAMILASQAPLLEALERLLGR